MKQMTLNQKINIIQRSVAYPTNENWGLWGDEVDKVVSMLNLMLFSILSDAKDNNWTWGELRDSIKSNLDNVEEMYPDSGIGDSETYETIALFFTIHYTPKIYNFLRYRKS